MDFSKSTKGGPFGSAWGRIPERGTSAPRPSPLNPLLALPKNYRDPVLAKVSVLAKIFEKGVLGSFWKILTKKLRFFGAPSPSKLVYFSAKGAFRKVLRSFTKNGCLKLVQRGDPLGRQGVESLWEKEASAPPPQIRPCQVSQERTDE